MKIRDARAKFEQFVLQTRKPLTARRYCRCLNIFFSYFPRKTHTQDFMHIDIEDYRFWRREDGIKNATINLEVMVAGFFWRWLVREGLENYNPTRRVKPLPVDHPTPDA